VFHTSFAFIGSTKSGRRVEAAGFDFISATEPWIDSRTQAAICWIEMREILEIEEHVPIPPMIPLG
jgi:hypothetical protein